MRARIMAARPNHHLPSVAFSCEMSSEGEDRVNGVTSFYIYMHCRLFMLRAFLSKPKSRDCPLASN